MNKFIQLLIPLIALIFSSSAIAEMYKWVDDNGNVTYSDIPPIKDAKELDPPVLNTMPTVKPSAKSPESEDEKQKETKYTFLKITSPESDATIRSNAGNITVSLNIQPVLNIRQGHYLSILVDGAIAQDNVSSLSTALSNIDRGTHSITASIKNKKGSVLIASKPVTIHIHRASTQPTKKTSTTPKKAAP